MMYMRCRFAAFRAVSKACMLWRLSMDDLQVCPLANVPVSPAARRVQCVYFYINPDTSYSHQTGE